METVLICKDDPAICFCRWIEKKNHLGVKCNE
nr:MAG TPA: hypothetical protein [Caudoviricetes sp.]